MVVQTPNGFDLDTSGKRIVVDPVTRIEGHLRIEVDVDDQGAISDAYSSGTSVRGLELILQGRDPRDAWAFAQRICGVCTLVHGLASVRAVEDALGIEVPRNAQLIRNLMNGAQYIHDHVMHFYHLHALDWVDVVSALSADPAATSALAQSISNYSKSSPGYFADMQKKVKDFVEAGQLGIFAKAYWGHPAYKLPPEANLMAVDHYLEALSWQRDVAKLHAIFGGKNPHPNFLVGGVASPIDLNSDSAINAKRLAQVQDIINKMQTFVDQVYIPDLKAIASFEKDWLGIDVEVVAVAPGPVITRFELDPAPGVKVSQIANLSKDLARALSTISVRVGEVIRRTLSEVLQRGDVRGVVLNLAGGVDVVGDANPGWRLARLNCRSRRTAHLASGVPILKP